MLSSQSRPVIEATLPVVGEHIQKIAARFYEQLFTAHPSCSTGPSTAATSHAVRQQQALAGSVAAFATGLVTSDAAPEKPAVADRAQARVARASSPTNTRSYTTS